MVLCVILICGFVCVYVSGMGFSVGGGDGTTVETAEHGFQGDAFHHHNTHPHLLLLFPQQASLLLQQVIQVTKFGCNLNHKNLLSLNDCTIIRYHSLMQVDITQMKTYVLRGELVVIWQTRGLMTPPKYASRAHTNNLIVSRGICCLMS